jgi:hypothetical protein
MVNIPGFSVHGVALARLYPEADSKMEPKIPKNRPKQTFPHKSDLTTAAYPHIRGPVSRAREYEDIREKIVFVADPLMSRCAYST